MKWLDWLFSPELKFGHWAEIDDDIVERINRLRRNAAELSDSAFDRANAFQLAATDLFVEKAQVHLTLRDHKYTIAGISLATICLFILTIIILIAMFTDITRYTATWELVILFSLRSAGIAGFAGAGIYFSASLSRAFFHEATTLYNRRHALRFGRMFVYLKYGESMKERKTLLDRLNSRDSGQKSDSHEGDSSKQAGIFESIDNALLPYLYRDVSAEELEKAFGWNLETYTGFRDMKPEMMSSNIYSRTLDVMGKLVESLAKIKSAARIGDRKEHD